MTDSVSAVAGESRDGIDAEHRQQLQLLGAFRDAVAAGRHAAELNDVLQQLVDFTDVHFMSEQLVMRLYEYPHYAAHVAEHDRIIEQVREMERRFAAGHVGDADRLAEEIHAALAGHTARSDAAFTRWLAEQHKPGG